VTERGTRDETVDRGGRGTRGRGRVQDGRGRDRRRRGRGRRDDPWRSRGGRPPGMVRDEDDDHAEQQREEGPAAHPSTRSPRRWPVGARARPARRSGRRRGGSRSEELAAGDGRQLRGWRPHGPPRRGRQVPRWRRRGRRSQAGPGTSPTDRPGRPSSSGDDGDRLRATPGVLVPRGAGDRPAGPGFVGEEARCPPAAFLGEDIRPAHHAPLHLAGAHLLRRGVALRAPAGGQRSGA
jgi:hypothetical protein